jgi:hypothetical protein
MSLPKFSLSCFTSVLLFLAASLPALAESHVRIVRLSYIEGGVQVSHPGAQAYEKAMVNLPIAEGMKLKTSDDGKAEVEFEDGSTLRLIPDSAIEFSKLSLRDSGSKVSDVEITKGTAYVNFVGTKDDEFALQFGKQKVDFSHAAHLRVDLGNIESVAVFKGLVQVESPSGALEVKKNQTVNFDASENGGYKLAKNIHQEPWDDWDDQQNEYHERYAAKSRNNLSPYSYGSADLAYYGNFSNYPGYGMLWQPYFAGNGWDPFMDGAWTLYPGWGYGWVSSYPWGWTPYHYGTWVFIPTAGWAWQPGGTWNTWSHQPVMVNPPKGFTLPQAPSTGTSTVVVNRGTVSTFAGSKLVLRNNSAGLGVPRGQFDNMAKLSHRVETHGSVSRHVEPVMINSSARMGATGTVGGMSQGRGGAPSRASAPPASHSSSMSMPSSHSTGASAGGASHR